jgi:hypothetical protein
VILYLEKNPSQEKELEEWLRVEALSTNPSTAKKDRRRFFL